MLSAETTIEVIGLGFVCLALAVEFGKQYKMFGYELSEVIVATCRAHEPLSDVSATAIQATTDTRLAFPTDHCFPLSTPVDVANRVAYLASPRSGFAKGGIWTLDGGQVHS